MVELSIKSETLRCKILGMHKVWAFKGSIDVPLRQIVKVTPRPEHGDDWWKGIRLLGTSLPGGIKAGLFKINGKTVFCDLLDAKKSIELELKDSKYDIVLIEVRDPDTAAKLIAQGLESLKS